MVPKEALEFIEYAIYILEEEKHTPDKYLTKFCLVIHHFLAVVTTIVYNCCVVVCYSSLRSQNCGIVYGNICCFVVPKEALVVSVITWVQIVIHLSS